MPFWRLILAAIGLAVVACGGCSTYTLRPISAKEAGSDYAAGGTYAVAYPQAVLVRSMKFGIGFGQPETQLDIVGIPEIGREARARVPKGTLVRIDRYVRYEQHGLYDCGANGWMFAIATVSDGKLAGKRFLIDSLDLHLNQHDPAYLLLAPPEHVSE